MDGAPPSLSLDRLLNPDKKKTGKSMDADWYGPSAGLEIPRPAWHSLQISSCGYNPGGMTKKYTSSLADRDSPCGYGWDVDPVSGLLFLRS